MFNTSPSQSPERSPAVLSMNEEIKDTLIEFGFINPALGLSPEDYEAIQIRKKIIDNVHSVPTEIAISLAYIDRKINAKHGNEEEIDRLFDVIINNTFLIKPFVPDVLLAENQEFLDTVAKTAVAHFKQGGYVAFSDALFIAIKERESVILNTPVVTGMLDGQDNVIPKN